MERKRRPCGFSGKVLGNAAWSASTLLFFNEADDDLLAALTRNIAAYPQAASLGVPPVFKNDVIDSSYRTCLNVVAGRPTLFFVDPFGYKEISLNLLRDLVWSGFGNDLIFFFNYRRINAAVSNDLFAQRMRALFGNDRAETLRREVEHLHRLKRETVIINAAAEELAEQVGNYVQRFRFAGRGDEASHYLFYVSKHPKGHEIMTNVMAARSSKDTFGVPTFEFSTHRQSSLFEVDKIADLADSLLSTFVGQTLTVGDIYVRDSSTRQLQKKAYKEALKRLEARGDVEMSPPAETRPSGTLADHVTVWFLREEATGR